jgi:SAM-dependent methyltransferase
MTVRLSDPEFDRLFPRELRHLSEVHWTPVEVAQRAARLLAPRHGRRARILDVGAGVGKACLVGALTSSAEWYGVERDGRNVEIAFRTARRLRVEDRTRFAQGDASLVDWSPFDGLYFYNPLGSLLSDAMGIPHELRGPTIDMMTRRLEQRLAQTRIGTRVVTYHGFGGEMPDGFEQFEYEAIATGVLQLWIRTRAGDSVAA